MAEQVNVIVDEAYMDRFDEVVERAQAAGLRVEHVLPEIGIVSGSVEPTRRHELERIPGVAEVDTQQEIQIPPPESTLH